MKALPPALVLFATALIAASFSACGTSSPQQDSLLRPPNSDSDSSHINPTLPTLSLTSIAPPQTSNIPELLPAIVVEPPPDLPDLPNLQTDPAFVPKRSYATSVTTVIDGDTITAMVDGKQMSIRLIGIDTPESSTSTRPEECGGEEASQFLRSILPEGAPILLTRDKELLDPYDRLLAYVFRKNDGLFVNLAIAKYGMASELSFPPNTRYASHIRKAVTTARTSGAGVWGLCGSTDLEL